MVLDSSSQQSEIVEEDIVSNSKVKQELKDEAMHNTSQEDANSENLTSKSVWTFLVPKMIKYFERALWPTQTSLCINVKCAVWLRHSHANLV